MNAVPFDTLKLAQRLEAAGLAAPVAAGASEALAEAMSGADLATKADVDASASLVRGELAELRSHLTSEASSLRAEIAATHAEIAATRTELKHDISSLRTELKNDISSLRTELKNDMEILKRDMTIRLGGMMTFLLGLAIGAARLVLHP